MGDIKASNGHNAVPVVTLYHNPKVQRSDDPKAGVVRGQSSKDRGTSPTGKT
jgi:hypothetical protein